MAGANRNAKYVFCLMIIDMYTIKNSSKSEQTTVEHGGNGGAAQS